MCQTPASIDSRLARLETSDTIMEINELQKVISNYRERLNIRQAPREALEISENIQKINDLRKLISNYRELVG